jgi:hypothetical protein
MSRIKDVINGILKRRKDFMTGLFLMDLEEKDENND